MKFNVKKVVIGIGIIVVMVVFYSVGNGSATTTINGKKVGYDKIVSKITDLKKQENQFESQIKDTQVKMDDLDTQFKSRQAQFQNAVDLSSKVDSMKSDLSSLTSDIKSKQGTSSSLDGQISSKKAELDKLQHVIQVTGEAPITLGAGQYTIGKDIKAGRYTVTNIGEGSNFFVYDSDGQAVVNTILGNGIGSGDYTFYCTDDETIETHGEIKLIPVK